MPARAASVTAPVDHKKRPCLHFGRISIEELRRRMIEEVTLRPAPVRHLQLEHHDREEILAVIAKMPRSVVAPRAPRGYPVRARFHLAWETALRPQTLDQLRAPDDYQRGRDYLVIRDEIDKARFGRCLPLTAGARRALDSVCPDIGLFFGQHDYRSVLRAAAKASGLPSEKADRISPYDFRHSRLTFLAEPTCPF